MREVELEKAVEARDEKPITKGRKKNKGEPRKVQQLRVLCGPGM